MESLLSLYVVDDLEYARVQPRIFDPELLAQAAPVHQVVAGIFAGALLGERDLRVGEKPEEDIRQLAEADRDPAGVVD